MKHITTISLLVFVLVAAEPLDATVDPEASAEPEALIEYSQVGPHVHINPELREYFLPSNACKVEETGAPISVIISSCKEQRKGWLKI